MGGIREQVLAAARAGIKTGIIPRRNEVDLDDVPDEVRRALGSVQVDPAERAIEAALVAHRRASPSASDRKAA